VTGAPRRALAWLRARPTLAAALVCALVALVLFSPAMAPGRTLSTSDTFWFQTPWAGVRPAELHRPANPDIDDVPEQYQLYTQFLRREAPDVPLWNPYLMAGRPFEANAQSAVFSIFTLPSLVLPFWSSLALVAALKLFLAAFGTFLLARALGQRFAGALLTGLAFGFSLWMVTWVGFVAASVWALLPWLLWTTDRLVRRPGPGPVAGLALVVGLQFFGGHPESNFHVLVATVAFFVFRVVARRRAGEPVALGRTAGAFAGSLALGGVLAAAVLLPFAELLFRSADTGQRASVAEASKLQVRFLLGFALPDYWGRGTQTALVRFQFSRACYAGVLPLMLAVAAPLLRPNLARLAVAGFGVACLAVAFGIPPVFDLVTRLPLFDIAHNERLIAIALLCVALLAGWGLDDLVGERAPPRRRVALALAGAVAVVPVLWVVGTGKAPLSVLGDALDVAWGFAHPPGPQAPDAGDVIRLAATIVFATFAAAAVALLVVRARGRLAAGAFAALAILLTVADLFRAGMGQNPAIERRIAVQPATGAIRYLQTRRPARFEGVGVVPSNVLSMRYGLREAGGYDLPIERRYDKLWRRVMSPEVPAQSGFFAALPLSLPRVDERRLRTLGLLGVADLLQPPGDAPLSLPGLRLAYRGPDARVYASERALPRAWVVGAQEVVHGGDAALRAITRPDFEPLRAAVTERRVPGVPEAPVAGAPAPAGAARLESIAPDRVRVRARADGSRPALLVVSDTDYPGWQATVDGKTTRVERVDDVLRGVRLAPGSHEVVLRFRPASWTAGWILSLAALLAVAGLSVAGLRRRRSGTRPAPARPG
jgi:hypothetical protein